MTRTISRWLTVVGFIVGAVLFRMIVGVGDGWGAKVFNVGGSAIVGLVIARRILRMSGGSHKKSGPSPS